MTDTLIPRYLRACRSIHQPMTLRRRGQTLFAFQAFVGGDLAHAHVDDVDAFLDRPLSRATRRAYLCDLRAFYAWARQRDLVRKDPTKNVPVPRAPQGRPRPLAADVQAAALRYGELRVRLAVALGALAGLRIGEIAMLHHDDVLDAAELIRVLGKGDKERYVPLHPRIAHLLAQTSRRGYVFPSPSGGHLRRDTLGRLVARHLRDYGAVGAVSHQLRHSFASNALDATGGDLDTVATLMGHERVETTRVYARRPPDAARRAVLALVA
jgi:site-specific recombinase XerD